MSHFVASLKTIKREDAIEYALVAVGVAIAIVTVITRTDGTLNNFFVTLSAAL